MAKPTTRRDFIKQTSAVSAGMAIAGLGMSTESYGRIPGANERMNFAVVGIRSRGQAHRDSLADCKNAHVSHICDVDQRYIQGFSEKTDKAFGHAPKLVVDYRKLLEIKDLDAVTIATPEHWHAPMAIMGLQAGKHVYLEKPCSHNPREGELLIKAQKKYKHLMIQMGNQQRSSAHTIHIINKIKEGLIGKVYYAKAWYNNTRGPIGIGKKVEVPDHLDWELWQGPAPRRPYKDNLHPYNWHWFWHYGTGETLNNGTHEVDVCRWALGVDYPKTVTATGGRYHYQDDWEFYDTLITTFDYGDKTLVWEGLSCQNKKAPSRGVTIHGTEGTVFIDRKGYTHYNPNHKVVEEVKAGGSRENDTANLVGGGDMTTQHFKNFINAIRTGKREALHSPIEDANISVTSLHLANIAWKMGRSLATDTKTGRIRKDKKAMAMWGREYQKGWELKV